MADLDVVVAARRELAASAAVTALVGPGPTAGSTYSTWIFQWRPYVEVVGSGQVLLVVSTNGGWAAPNTYNTMNFPVLQIEIVADADRAGDLNPRNATGAEQKAAAIVPAIDAIFHQPNPEQLYWGGTATEPPLRVVRSVKLNEPSFTTLPRKEGDGAVSGFLRYGLVI